MSEARRPPLAPLLTAGIAALITLALMLVFFLVLLPYRRDHPAGGFSGREAAAVTAAGTGAADVVSYTRKNFDRDYARALAGTTGSLHTQVAKNKAATQDALTQGKFDLTAQVTHAALQGPAPRQNGYLVLVTLDAGRSNLGPTLQKLQVTVLDVKGRWLVSDLTAIDVEGS